MMHLHLIHASGFSTALLGLLGIAIAIQAARGAATLAPSGSTKCLTYGLAMTLAINAVVVSGGMAVGLLNMEVRP